MKKITQLLLGLVVLVSLPALALADFDTYIGDSAIYSLQGGGGLKPNILFVVDNSNATQNVAVGYEYDPSETYTGPYNTWDIHVGDNLGEFETVAVADAFNADGSLNNLACSGGTEATPVDLTNNVVESLLNYGSYSSAGNLAKAPNINRNTGACEAGPKGNVYLLGNYLNYLNVEVPEGAGLTCVARSPFHVVTGTKVGNVDNRRFFELHTPHATVAKDESAGESGNEPGVADSDWGSYWTEVTASIANNDANKAANWQANFYYVTDAADCPADAGNAAASTQREVIYTALETVLQGAKHAALFGAMVYGPNNKGAVVLEDPSDPANTTDIADISDPTKFAKFIDLLPGSASGGASVLSSQVARPQAEAVYDAGYYYGASYPGEANTDRAPQSVLDQQNCGNSHIILLTNGLSNTDGGSANTLAGSIGDYDQDGWPDESVYGEGSHYLDDVASYLQSNLSVKTHTVLAFQSLDPLLKNTADDGGGRFYNVYDANTLAKAIQELILYILLEANSVFVAPVVPSNPENRTFSGSRIYMGLFRTVAGNDWIGNLKKYGLSNTSDLLDYNGIAATNVSGDIKATSKSFWWSGSTNPDDEGDGGVVDSGGVGALLAAQDNTPGSGARKIYSNLDPTEPDLTASANLIDLTIAPEKFGFAAAATGLRDAAVNYIYGLDVQDLDQDGIVAENRRWVLGDILHSKPAVVTYNVYPVQDLTSGTLSASHPEDTCPSNWATDFTNVNRSIIYVGSNDGMLHAFRDCDGGELWSFLPDNLLLNIHDLASPVHNYFVDSSSKVYVYDGNKDGNINPADGDKALLIMGQRRGAGKNTNDQDGDGVLDVTPPSFGAYYVLDVSNPAVPKFLWKIDNSTTDGSGNLLFKELAETWSEPALGKIKYDTGSGVVDMIAAFVGGGYDNLNEDGRFGQKQHFSNVDVVSPTTDAGHVHSAGTVWAANVTNNPRGRAVYGFEIARLDSSGVPTIPSAPNKVFSMEAATASPISDSVDAHNRSTIHLNYSIAAEVAVVDTDFDNYIDRLYVSDAGGQVWRISSHNSVTRKPYANPVINHATNGWYGEVIFWANEQSNNAAYVGTKNLGRKIFYRPSVVVKSGYVGLFFGTGDRAHPLNRAVKDMIFMVKDRGQRLHGEGDGLGQTSRTVTLTNLVDVSLLEEPGNPENATTTPCGATDTSNECIRERLADPNNFGWFYDPGNTAEKFLAAGLVFGGKAFITSYTPELTVSGQCTPGNLGTARVYALNFSDGGAALNLYGANDTGGASGTDAVIDGSDRSKDVGTGIPPEPTITLPKGEGQKPDVILPDPEGINVIKDIDTMQGHTLYWLSQ